MACEKLKESSAKKMLADVDNVLFDCEGVLWDSRCVISGSVDTVKRLIANGKKVYYITNSSSKTREQCLQTCLEYGYPATIDDIVCTPYIAALYLRNKNFKGKVYVVGNTAMAAELDAQGIKHFGVGPDPSVDSMDEWIEYRFDPEVKCVLVGLDLDISYTKILKAASYLQRPDCLFLATNEDTHLPVSGSATRVPGSGAIVAAVSLPSERLPTVVGKPEPAMFEELQKLHNLVPNRCLMVGDRVPSDIALAKSCDLKSLLVLSGVTSEAEVPDIQKGKYLSPAGTDAPIIPDFYTSCLGDLGKFI